jgi:hypothetical protein
MGTQEEAEDIQNVPRVKLARDSATTDPETLIGRPILNVSQK